MTRSKRSIKSVRSAVSNRSFGKVLLLLGGIAFALLVAEVLLRLVGFNYFNPYVPDQDVGYSLKPNVEGWWKREGLTYVRINSHGFHDREHTIAKPPDTFRIAVLGDSYVEAFQVPIERAFWSVMERKLQECHPTNGRRIEVLSFGVSGFSTSRELILLQKRVWQYSPDVVVLLVTSSNDIRDNSRRLSHYTNALPYFVIQDGKLALDDSQIAARSRTLTFRLRQSFIGTAFNWLQNHSRLLGLIYTIRENYQSSSDAERRRKQSGDNDEPGLDKEVYREPVSPDWEEAWQVTESLLKQMDDEVNAKHAKFLVVTGSTGVQVNPDLAVRNNFMSRLGVNSLWYPDERIKRFGELEGFKVLNLAPVLGEYASRNQVFLHGADDNQGRGHWNERGHRLTGELIAQDLCGMVQ